MAEYLLFNREALPSKISLTWNGRKLTVVCRRNSQMDRYVLDVYAADGAPIVYGRVVSFGRDALFGVAHVHTRGLGVMAFDKDWAESGKDASAETFMRSVLPYIVPRWE